MHRMAPQDHDLCLPKDRAMEKTTEARASPATAPEFTEAIRQATASGLQRLSNLPDAVRQIS